MENLSKSLEFDTKILKMHGVSLSSKILLLIKKYQAILGVIFFKNTKFKIGSNSLKVNSFSEIGTIQSSLVDFYEDIVASEVLATSSPKIVDVGANIGQFSNAALYFYPNAEIIAFEPDSKVCKKYQRNINTNKHNVTIHNFGVGAKEETLVFYKTKLSGMSSFVKPEEHNLVSREELKIKTLDSFEIKNVDLLKIDVEGFEYDVLVGGQSTLNQSKQLLIELSLRRAIGKTNLSILEYIRSSVPSAQLVKFGRPLGNINRPQCQDVLITLKPASNG